MDRAVPVVVAGVDVRAQLVEEVGEVARILSRTYGDQSFKGRDLGLFCFFKNVDFQGVY